MLKQQAKYCIIVAGGSGLRMESDLPKQFIELNGKPVLMHTVEKFYHFDSEIRLIIALPKDQQEFWVELCAKHRFTIPHMVVNGGITRFHSVKNALEKVNGSGLIAVHDGVRPLVSSETITRCYAGAEENGAAVPVIAVSDSVRILSGNESQIVDRTQLRLVQTPQVFQADVLLAAYKSAFRPEFTDDASVVEYMGKPIALVDGNIENIKLTYPSDIIIAKTLLRMECSNQL